MTNEYLKLRETIKGLGRLKGERSTGEIIERLDSVWRAMLRLRAEMLGNLKITGHDISNYQNTDFLSIYLSIHNATEDSRLCKECLSAVDFTLKTCPFCASPVNGPNSDEDKLAAVIDFDQPEHRPDWDIDYSSDSEMLEKEKLKRLAAQTPEIKPITKRDDIPGPTGIKVTERKRKLKHLPYSSKMLLAWIERRELCEQVPFTREQLNELNHQKLRQIAYLFPSNPDLPSLSPLTKDELVAKILGCQDTETPSPGPKPYTKEVDK